MQKVSPMDRVDYGNSETKQRHSAQQSRPHPVQMNEVRPHFRSYSPKPLQLPRRRALGKQGNRVVFCPRTEGFGDERPPGWRGKVHLVTPSHQAANQLGDVRLGTADSR